MTSIDTFMQVPNGPSLDFTHNTRSGEAIWEF